MQCEPDDAPSPCSFRTDSTSTSPTLLSDNAAPATCPEVFPRPVDTALGFLTLGSEAGELADDEASAPTPQARRPNGATALRPRRPGLDEPHDADADADASPHAPRKLRSPHIGARAAMAAALPTLSALDGSGLGPAEPPMPPWGQSARLRREEEHAGSTIRSGGDWISSRSLRPQRPAAPAGIGRSGDNDEDGPPGGGRAPGSGDHSLHKKGLPPKISRIAPEEGGEPRKRVRHPLEPG